uniref:Uncharacterized protein n=1 Tax=Aegilops tauschii subsp. strangulata TaxID=200361 RepID=A0A453LMX3_AEGTS
MLTFRSGEVIRPSHKNKQKVTNSPFQPIVLLVVEQAVDRSHFYLVLQVYFGQNLVCKESVSAKGKGRIVKVGDPVYVLQTYPCSDEVPA